MQITICLLILHRNIIQGTALALLRGVAQLASALAWGARGRKFESSHPDNKETQSAINKLVAFLFSGICTTIAPPQEAFLYPENFMIICLNYSFRVY